MRGRCAAASVNPLTGGSYESINEQSISKVCVQGLFILLKPESSQDFFSTEPMDKTTP